MEYQLYLRCPIRGLQQVYSQTSCSQVEKSRHYVLPVPKVPEILKNNDKYYYMKLVAILCCSVDGKLLRKEKQF